MGRPGQGQKKADLAAAAVALYTQQRFGGAFVVVVLVALFLMIKKSLAEPLLTPKIEGMNRH